MTTVLNAYRSRMQRVLDHIDRNLDSALDLEAVSSVAAFSKFHFHRQFSAIFDMSLHRYVQLARLKRAADGLVGQSSRPIIEIALDAGYEAPDAFARAFRQRLGVSPSAFRKSPDWGAWILAFAPLTTARSRIMQIVFEPRDVAIIDMPDTPVAVMSHRGDRSKIPDTARRFRAWRAASGLSPETASTYMIFRSEREPANPDDYAMDLCLGTDLKIDPADTEMQPGVIPGGRCAVIRYPGNTNNLEPAATYLYQKWLPMSGEEPRDFPIFSRRRLAAIAEVEGAYEVVLELIMPLK